ncbi:MAG: hypothetical protein ACP59X_06685 [Solidesulfovibrio sp. DCME]|uniref:hypothetical protein n=1 Tax=Solidesulfovibrio sp. DCME TaxID=3447380 RepID=UPI003D0D1B45
MRRPISRIVSLVLLSLCLGTDPLLAAPEQEGSKKTLYGMFQQSAMGGINFVDPQEPEVVYIPFDATSILSDDLNVKVQVQGSIVNSFVRNGKTYRIITVDSVKPMTAEYGATTIASGQHTGLPGTDAVTVHTYHNKTCYLYDRYAVLERLAAYSNGHDLRVLARGGADNPDAVCESLEGSPLFEIPNDGDFTFAGLSGDILFIRNGQADAVHGLLAVNLTQQKQILDATVLPGASVAKGALRYAAVAGAQKGKGAGTAKAACPAGKTAAQDMSLDLRTGKSTAVGKVTCR